MSTEPTFVKPASLHPVSADLLSKPRDQYSGLNPIEPAARPGATAYDTVAGGVADLEAAFAHAITPTEVAWAQGKTPTSDLNAEPRPVAPPKFKNAYHSIIDALLIDPSVTVTRLSTLTGYSRTWLHKVMSTDSFQAQLATRQKNCVDDHIRVAVMDRLSGLGSRALEILEERLDGDKVDAAFALEVAQFTTKAQGIGQQKVQNTQNFIVQVPVPMTNAQEWATMHAPAPVQGANGDTPHSSLTTLVQPLDMGQAEVVDAASGEGATDE